MRTSTRALLALILCLSLDSRLVHAQAVECLTSIEGTQTAVTGRFHVWRSGQRGVHLRYRDLEFMWDNVYGSQLTDDMQTTLTNFARTQIDIAAENPFGSFHTPIQLSYNYFRGLTPGGGWYNTTNPLDSTSFVMPRFTSLYTNADRAHADLYIVSPGDPNTGNRLGALYTEAYEDTSTGHSTQDPKHNNSLQIKGPSTGSSIDLSRTGWTRLKSEQSAGFIHELHHGFTNTGATTMDEMFSAAAEALCVGNEPATGAGLEVPYTWSLLANSGHLSCAPLDCCTEPHTQLSNYFGRTMFTRYLAYNYRGADTTATGTGLNDDLLRRWARNPAQWGFFSDSSRHWGKLEQMLSDDSCGTCVGKNYFKKGGAPLPNYDRLQLLHHNWRVANYVNKSSLAEGQYGYPPHFGFSPANNLRAWKSVDGCATDDIVALPPAVTLTSAYVTRELTKSVKRVFRGSGYRMRLLPYGSEYWVVRSDTASLGTTPRDLVVTVYPESIYRCIEPTGVAGEEGDVFANVTGRLMASIVAYTQQDPDSVEAPQWAHPEWATLALQPKWVDVDSVAGPLEFVVPGFGTTYKAALVAITLADGPTRQFSQTSPDSFQALGISGRGRVEALPYRLNLALRGAPNDTLLGPRSLVADSTIVADWPAWSPAGNEVAFTRTTGSGASRIYRKQLSGGSATELVAGTEKQWQPDWSPRGDWIAYVQQPTGSNDKHIWRYNVVTATVPLQLTSGTNVVDQTPAFQPNGQIIAYARFLDLRWQLRRINLDGTGDIALVYPGTGDEIRSVRWSPDGQWVYFTRNDSAYKVARTGGALQYLPEILSKVRTLDLHLGGWKVLAEQPATIGCTACPTQGGLSAHRLVLRDTVQKDTQVRFYHTGAEYNNPRWSFDGRLIAYSSNINKATDRDLFFGQVSYNQAPLFTSLPDTFTVYAGTAFEVTLNATDADGEALTYEMPATFLPSGSSFSPSTRKFTWSNPWPAGAQHYVVARVKDGSGGVANKVIKLSVAIGNLSADIVGSNEVWLPWTAPGDNGSIGRADQYDLRYSTSEITPANFHLATNYPLSPGPAVPEQQEYRGVFGLSPGTNYWFAIREKYNAANRWSPVSNVIYVQTTTGGGGGMRAQESHDPAARRASSPMSALGGDLGGDGYGGLAVEMSVKNGSPYWQTLALDASEAAALGGGEAGVVFQVKDGSGEWVTRAQIPSSDASWRYAVAPKRTPSRTVFLGNYGLQQAWDEVRLGPPGSLSALTVQSAQHSRLGDAQDDLDGTANDSVAVSVGDTLSLTASWETVSESPASSWLMLIGPPGSAVEVAESSNQRGEIGEEGRVVLPAAFALHQNHPNPFAGQTLIRFELPVETTVRLEVFDAQGRRIRSLATGTYPAGFHSAEWNQRDEAGKLLGPGVYLYRIQAGSFRDQKKMVLLP